MVLLLSCKGRSFKVLDLSPSMLYSPSENTVHVYCSTMYGAHIQSPFSQIIIVEI